MVPIVQQLCPEDRYPIKCPFTREPNCFVVHNTANDAPAVNEITYMIRRPEQVSFHYAIDPNEIRQGLPVERNAWASSDGRGPGNMYGIHIEICYSKSGGLLFDKSEENAAEFIASQLLERNWGLDRVKTHWDFDPEKRCPHRTLDKGWDRFLQMIQKYMDEMSEPKKEEEEEVMSYEKWVEYQKRYEAELAVKDVDGWADVVWKKAAAAGIVDGKRPRSAMKREEFVLVLDRLGLIPSGK